MDNKFKEIFVDGILSMFDIKELIFDSAKIVPAIIFYSNNKASKYCLTIKCEYKENFSHEVIKELENTLLNLKTIENINKLEVSLSGKIVSLYLYANNKSKLMEYKKGLEEIKGE